MPKVPDLKQPHAALPVPEKGDFLVVDDEAAGEYRRLYCFARDIVPGRPMRTVLLYRLAESVPLSGRIDKPERVIMVPKERCTVLFDGVEHIIETSEYCSKSREYRLSLVPVRI